MSSEYPLLDELSIKAELRKRKVYQTEIARACGVSQPTVSYVIRGEMHGAKAREIMLCIASHLSLPVTELFPQYERRKAA